MKWHDAVSKDWTLCEPPTEELVFVVHPPNPNYDAFAQGIESGNVYRHRAINAPDTYGRNTWYTLVLR